MDPETLRRHLAQANEHVAQGERLIAEQRERIRLFALRGNDTSRAEELLRLFEDTQAHHVADRDRLIAELAGY